MTKPGTDLSIDQPAESPSVLAQVLVPIVAIGATMAARRLLDFGYERVTGRTPPRAMDPSTSLRQALLWAALGAVVAAEVEVLVHRQLNRPHHTA